MVEVKLTFTDRTAHDIKVMLAVKYGFDISVDMAAMVEYHLLKMRADKAKAESDEAARIANEATRALSEEARV